MQQDINKEWFIQRLDEQRKSVRGLARHLGIDAGAASRMLAGKRRMRMDEASQIAAFLAAPVTDVLRHAGVAIDLEGQPTRILLAAIINESGQVERLNDPKPLPPSFVERAHAVTNRSGNGQIIAAQIRALDGPLSVMDDALVLFSCRDEVEPGASGSLSICRSYEGDQFMAKIDRVRKTGEARIMAPEGKVREVFLQSATPVLAIIP